MRDVFGEPGSDGSGELGRERPSDWRQSALLGIDFEPREALDEAKSLGELKKEREARDRCAKVVSTCAEDSSRDGGGSTRGGDGVKSEVNALVSDLSQAPKSGVDSHGKEGASERAALEDSAKTEKEKNEGTAGSGVSKNTGVKSTGEIEEATWHAVALEDSEHESV